MIPYNSQVWLAVFMMLGSVLMLNLLIAVFSKTYEDMTAEVSNRKCLFIPAQSVKYVHQLRPVSEKDSGSLVAACMANSGSQPTLSNYLKFLTFPYSAFENR